MNNKLTIKEVKHLIDCEDVTARGTLCLGKYLVDILTVEEVLKLSKNFNITFIGIESTASWQNKFGKLKNKK